jgi:hypothetical protein
MRSTSVVLFFCPLCFVLTVLNITLLSCQAWDGWTPPVTTSIASKALSIKDHAFAPAAGTAEVAGWTPVTSVATVAASSLSAHSSSECSMGSVSKGLSIKDHAFVPAAGATGWTEHAAADGRAFYYHANSQTSQWEAPPGCIVIEPVGHPQTLERGGHGLLKTVHTSSQKEHTCQMKLKRCSWCRDIWR